MMVVTEMGLRIENVSKNFDKVEAVRNFSLEIPEGLTLALLGPSGCGKTTVLRLIAGLERPDKGNFFIRGAQVTGLPPRNRNVAMVFQDFGLYPHKTVEKNITYPLRLKKHSKDDIQEKVEWVTELVQIRPLLERFPHQLSGGEAQRVALAKAIVREPDLFLLDEPLSNIDAQLRIILRQELKRLLEKLKITTLFVTHDQEDAMALGDLVAIMNQGELLQLGTAKDIYRRPANTFAARFIGKPGMNLLPVDFREGKLYLHDDLMNFIEVRQAIRDAISSKDRFILGLRPESLQLSTQLCTAHDGIRAFVEFVETIEPHPLVHLNVGHLNLTAELAPEQSVVPGQEVSVKFSLEDGVCFDEDGDQKRIWPLK
jgi:multiple sugar transport system ATP-binding protein